MSLNPDELDQPRSDQGVPVGDADVQQDRLNAADDPDRVSDDDGTWAARSAMDEQTDQGEAVGTADVEADQRNAE